METHVFDLRGPYALFRKPYAPVSPVSFPVPPPPTVMGMIGAICGYGRDEYLDRIGWDEVEIGVGLQRRVQRLRTGINLLNTKQGEFFSTDPNRIQIPHEFLKRVHLRLYVANGRPEMMEDLGNHLKNDTTTYNISLGLEQCLADFEHVATTQAEPVDGEVSTQTAIPQSKVSRIEYEEDNRYGNYRVPHRMRPGRQVTSYSQIVVEETASPTTVHTNQAFQVGEDVVLFH